MTLVYDHLASPILSVSFALIFFGNGDMSSSLIFVSGFGGELDRDLDVNRLSARPPGLAGSLSSLVRETGGITDVLHSLALLRSGLDCLSRFSRLPS